MQHMPPMRGWRLPTMSSLLPKSLTTPDDPSKQMTHKNPVLELNKLRYA